MMGLRRLNPDSCRRLGLRSCMSAHCLGRVPGGGVSVSTEMARRASQVHFDIWMLKGAELQTIDHLVDFSEELLSL